MKKHYTISPGLIGGTVNAGFMYAGHRVSRKTLRKHKPEIMAVHFTPMKPAVVCLQCTCRGIDCRGDTTFVVLKRDLLDPCLFDGLEDRINNQDFDIQAFVHELINDQLLKNKIGGQHGSRLIHNETA